MSGIEVPNVTCACGTTMTPIYNGAVVGCPHCDRNVCAIKGCDSCREARHIRRV